MPAPADPVTGSLRDQLTDPVAFPLDLGQSQIVLAARMGEENTRTSLPLTGGLIGVSAESDGTLVVNTLEISVDDILVQNEKLPEEGLLLSGLKLTLYSKMPGDTLWATDDEAHASTTGDFLLSWSISVGDDEPAALPPQPISGIPFEVHARKDVDGSIIAELVGAQPGVFWAWADYVELSELAFELRGELKASDLL